MEKSESGQPIYRYSESDKNDFAGASGDSSIDEITEHIEGYIGDVDMVFHEIISDQVHIDVHWVKATEKFPFHTLVTSGMSDKPMTTPPGVENANYAELYLPSRRLANFRRSFSG